jgi:hypothetical protein
MPGDLGFSFLGDAEALAFFGDDSDEELARGITVVRGEELRHQISSKLGIILMP